MNDNTKNPLSTPANTLSSQAKSIFIDINNKLDIYAAGYYIDNLLIAHPCYWKNFNLNSLNVAGYSIANSIFVSGGKAFVAGSIGNINTTSCYWENGVLNNLPDGNTANSIFAYNGEVYIAGTASDTGLPAAYWKNQQLIWNSGGFGSIANSICICNSDVYIAGSNDSVAACYWKNGNEVDLPCQVPLICLMQH